MNAVVRTVASDSIFTQGVLANVSLPELRILLMVFLLLISALGVVYVKDINRRLFITYHKLQIQNEQLESDRNKLLLEQSAWAAQARVQVVAQQQLQMQVPLSSDVQVIKA